MKAFVAGGTGFVGRKLCRALLDDGHEVTVITRGSGALPGGAMRLEGNPALDSAVWELVSSPAVG